MFLRAEVTETTEVPAKGTNHYSSGWEQLSYMGWKDFCWTNHNSGSRELWERSTEKSQRCKILDFVKIRQMLLAHLDFSVRKPPPAFLHFLFIFWSKETWLVFLANKSDCIKTLHDSISSSSQKKHDTEKPWIVTKLWSQRSMGFPAAEFYGFFAAVGEYLVRGVLPEEPMWHITAPQSTQKSQRTRLSAHG